EGALAVEQAMDKPYGLTSDRAGGFYVASQNRVYRVNTDGTIHVVAGSGTSGFSGDGGSAVSARLNNPYGLATDAAGNLYVNDSYRIRKITPGGVITTIAGNGTEGFSGDGGTAKAAQLHTPRGIAVDTSGNLYFADNDRVRRVTTDGVIHTVAGGGHPS